MKFYCIKVKQGPFEYLVSAPKNKQKAINIFNKLKKLQPNLEYKLIEYYDENREGKEINP